MAISGKTEANGSSSVRQTGELPRLRWTQILAINALACAFNFHWAALGTIILPSQVAKIAGNLQKGTDLAMILIPGAFVALFASPLFGWLSDCTGGRLAFWGRRRPYILLGTLVNIGSLIWMANARTIPTLVVGYILVQFSSNAAQAPFHALLPDLVRPEQRGFTSGMLGLLNIGGYIGGVFVAGILVDSSKPFLIYQRGVWLAYGIVMAVMLLFMLVTLVAVGGHEAKPGQKIPLREVQSAQGSGERRTRQPWLTRSLLVTLGGTALALGLAWGGMTFWNAYHSGGFQFNSTVQQIVLDVLATIGILRLFDFHPRRNPDFAWVLATRLIMMLGVYTIQDFLQYYMQDAVGVADPEQATTRFVILVAITSLISSFAAGWLSDRFGRKRLVFLAGFTMAFVGGVFVITHAFPIVIAAGALFGLGYGAYQSVDWALVVDVLPSQRSSARDMGVWNVALALPQVLAPALGGPIRDAFARAGNPLLGYQLLFLIAIGYCIIGTVTVRFIRGTS